MLYTMETVEGMSLWRNGGTFRTREEESGFEVEEVKKEMDRERTSLSST